ncbi:MAG: putative Ig domain-containing protein, partial [Planctomycetes bacterium]|nr:putative Ig domain-containing protein [Planctomycetota bacterium]
EDWYDQGNNHFSGWLPGQGLLVGSPSATGTYNFTLRAIGYLNRSITKEFSITVTVTPLSITTNSLPQGDPNIAYSTTLGFNGGITPVTWSIINGSLPSGITLNSQTGVIAGTTTEAGTTAYFTVQASSYDGQTINKNLSLYIAPALTVHTESLPQPVYNTPYSTVISVTGGTVISATVVDGEYGDWFAGTGYLITLEGTLPPGLGLTSTNGDPCEWYSQSNQNCIN